MDKPLQTLEYSPDGEAIPDVQIHQRTLEFINSNRTHWKVSTSNVIYQARVFIKHKVIKHTDLLFYINNKMSFVNEDAKFCNHNLHPNDGIDNLLVELL